MSEIATQTPNRDVAAKPLPSSFSDPRSRGGDYFLMHRLGGGPRFTFIFPSLESTIATSHHPAVEWVSRPPRERKSGRFASALRDTRGTSPAGVVQGTPIRGFALAAGSKVNFGCRRSRMYQHLVESHRLCSGFG